MNNQQEPEPLGIAGQKIHRRKLMTMVSMGFAVLSVGARNSVGALKGQAYPCGSYEGGSLTGDISCGVGESEDVSCGQPITLGGGGQVGTDYACGEPYDADCGQPGSGSYTHSDSNCAASGLDLACGLPGSPSGEPIQDSGW